MEQDLASAVRDRKSSSAGILPAVAGASRPRIVRQEVRCASATLVVISSPEAARLVSHTMDRIAMLNEILTENPKDAFARYGLAMEYSKQGDFDRALAEFSILLESHPEYTAGYFMAAQTLVRAERVDDAKKMLTDGIASARRTGNLHAQSEMEAMLAELG
ncbi:MAG TPA: tetratricopeptide repeat protein [Candidatus Binatus sp.]|nr:tetratricopeptide repeat protein [Candidatus Binatus sp.]